jgi:hypothetical protein
MGREIEWAIIVDRFCSHLHNPSKDHPASTGIETRGEHRQGRDKRTAQESSKALSSCWFARSLSIHAMIQ